MNAILTIALITVAVIVIGWANPKFDRIEDDGEVRVIMWYYPLFKTERRWITIYKHGRI